MFLKKSKKRSFGKQITNLKAKMNLFFLHVDPKQCAKLHLDKHCVKMILELVQMLYTAHRLLKSENIPLDGYRPFSPQHPTCIWVRQCAENYRYCVTLAKCLCEEYTYRYHRVHTCEPHIDWLSTNYPTFKEELIEYRDTVVLSYNEGLQALGCTPVPLAMPEDVKYHDTIKSYRMYYVVYKRRFATWKGRSEPWWFTRGNYKLFT